MCVKSILDNDLYKFTTSYAYMKLFPQAVGTFTFHDRDNTEYNEEFLKLLTKELKELSELYLHNFEFLWVKNKIRFIPEYYWEWLNGFKYDFNKIKFCLDNDNHLHIKVTDSLYKVTLYEVPILAIVSEVRNKWLGYEVDNKSVIQTILKKIEYSNEHQLKFSEFGTRRRFSYDVQHTICAALKLYSKYCTGTSNVYLGFNFDMNIIGTHPHEWFMFHGAQFGYKQANYLALENWVNVYDGDLGIALTDTYTSNVFFENFSRKHAKLFDGVRHDSGDPYEFINKTINKYKEFGIDPTTKTIIFSNGLNFEEYHKINDYCKGKIRCAAGIGTNLTNDCGFKPSNIVMKLTSCQITPNNYWESCIKLSDDEDKQTGNEDDIGNCLYELNLT